MYRKSELAAAAAKAEQNRALQNRAFDRVIASQLSKIKAAAPKKKVDTDEEFKVSGLVCRWATRRDYSKPN